MRASIFFAFAFLALFANAQLVERFVIDDFTVNQGQAVEVRLSRNVDTTDPGQGEVADSSSTFDANCSGLLGCARDMRITVLRGDSGRTFSNNIFASDKFEFEGEWAIAQPKGGSTINELQYDGNDGSFNLDVNGLNNFDFTDNGLTTGIRFFGISDQQTDLIVTFFNANGGQCDTRQNLPNIRGQDYTRDDISIDFSFGDFSGNCDFSNIGAVQFTVPGPDGDDVILRQVRALGLPDPSNSPSTTPTASRSPAPSQSRSPAPSQSRTPTPAPSQSRTPRPSTTNTATATPTRTPSRTPSPSGPCIEFCVCPSFTCQIAFDQDDDVNNVVLNPATSQFFFDDSDDNAPQIIYVDDDANPDDDRVVYIEVDDDDLNQSGGNGNTFTVPTFTVPTFTVPTFTVPSFTVPSFTAGTVTFPTVSVPTVTVGDDDANTAADDDDDDDNVVVPADDDDDDDASGDSASSSSALILSVSLVLIAAFI